MVKVGQVKGFYPISRSSAVGFKLSIDIEETGNLRVFTDSFPSSYVCSVVPVRRKVEVCFNKMDSGIKIGRNDPIDVSALPVKNKVCKLEVLSSLNYMLVARRHRFQRFHIRTADEGSWSSRSLPGRAQKSSPSPGNLE